MTQIEIAALHLVIGLFMGGAIGLYCGVALAGRAIRHRAISRGLERELTKFIALME